MMKAVWLKLGNDCEQFISEDKPTNVLGRIWPTESPSAFNWSVELCSNGNLENPRGIIYSIAKARVCVEAVLLIYGVIESEHTVAQIITDALLEDLDIDYSL